ncbi:MAG: hypothetical protein PVH11_08790 [Anaerolineae bacterium]
MQFVHYRMAYEIMEQRARQAEARSQTEAMLRQAGIEPQGWLRWQAGRVLAVAGRGLVVFGQWLERLGRPQPVCMEQARGTPQ